MTRTVAAGASPGWQIALIAIGAALFAAAAAVLLDRTSAAWRRDHSVRRPAASRRFGQPDEDPEFPHGRAEIVSEDDGQIGSADLAVPRTRHT